MNIQMPHCKRIGFLLLVSTVLLNTGCRQLEQHQQTDFLKPFATASSPLSGRNRGTMPSDHTLCVETAKTVAAEGHADEAIKLYLRAEKIDPKAASVDAQLAPLYASVGNYPAAIERYQRCVKKSPSDIDLCNNFAWTLMEAGHHELAITEATRGLNQAGNHARLQATLAMIHYRQGNHDKAFQSFETAQGSTAAHHNLSLLDIDAGNLESAREHLRAANQSGEHNSQSQILLTAFETQTTGN